MNILHTADWHLGHRLHEHAQLEEQTLFLKWLTNYIVKKEVDVLLISGDIFDTGAPSNQSLELYYNFLVGLKDTCCNAIIITGGNHDSPGTLNAPRHILDALAIKVIGKATDLIEDEVFKINLNNETVIIAAVPYLRDGDIRKAVAGETFDDLVDKYKAALVNHYQEAAIECERVNNTNAPVIAMGHLFAIGGSVSDSEQNIYVGSLGHIGAADFPEYYDYVALGHLHRPQIVGDNERVRYSGSPYVLSFSEVDYNKKVVLLTITDHKITKITEDTVPHYRAFYQLKGTVAECIAQFPDVQPTPYGLTPWVEIILDEDSTVNTEVLKKKATEYTFDILKIALKKQRRQKGIEALLKASTSIKELKPKEVFELKCKEINYDLEKHPAVRDAFNEILQHVKQQ